MKPATHVPRPSPSSSPVSAPAAPKLYDLNSVPRPQPRLPLEPEPGMASAAPSNAYQQAVAVPRKGDPVELAAPAAIPAAASVSMRIKLPDPPLTAQEYYSRASSISNAPAASDVKPVTMEASKPAVKPSGGGYSQKVVVPRKNATPPAVAPSLDAAPASTSMSIKLPQPPKTAEEYYSASGSRAQQGQHQSANARVKMQQQGKQRPAKAAKFPSLKSRYTASSSNVDAAAAASAIQQPTAKEQEVVPTETIASQQESNELAQKAVSTISEVASDIAAGFGTVRAIHIHINAPVEVHIHQAKMSSKL